MSERLHSTGTNMGFLADYLEASLYCQVHEFRSTQAVLLLDRVVPNPPFTLSILQKINERD